MKVEISPHYVSSRSAAAALLHHIWASRLSTTCGSHGTIAAELQSPPSVIVTYGVTCVFVCAVLHAPGMRVWSVQSKTRYFTSAAQQQQHNASRASSSCICASSHGVCLWLVPNRRLSHDNIFTSRAAIKHTSSGLIPGIRSITQKQWRKQCLIQFFGMPMFPLIHLRRPQNIKATLSQRRTLHA